MCDLGCRSPAPPAPVKEFYDSVKDVDRIEVSYLIGWKQQVVVIDSPSEISKFISAIHVNDIRREPHRFDPPSNITLMRGNVKLWTLCILPNNKLDILDKNLIIELQDGDILTIATKLAGEKEGQPIDFLKNN